MIIQSKLKNLFFLFLFIPIFSIGEVKLPKLVSNGMVLQRDAGVKIWGWASNGEKIAIQFIGATYNTVADSEGNWEITLSKMKAGGPYEMKIDGTNSITVSDILIGDVWICSGQSNMQYSLGGSADLYPDEIAGSENPNIRQFGVFGGFNIDENQTDFRRGSWQSANPQSVLRFSAIAYFFARKLYDEYKVPIGLISNAVGGSSAEAWISEESIKEFPSYWEAVQRYKKPGYMDRINEMDNERVNNWNKEVKENDEGHKNGHNWFNPDINISDWGTMHVPGYWADTEIGNINGIVWFRRQFNVPANMAGKQVSLKFGRIADADSVMINGKFIGSTGSQYSERNYRIPEGLLKEGTNTIIVKITNYIRHGGFVPGKHYEISTESNTINLEGDWKVKVGSVASDQLEDRLFTGKIPTGLFKGLIAPLLNYKIKGAIWYQGESNTSRAFEHYDLFKLLIKDWRQNWNQGDFPFLFVQLPNFTEVNIESTKYDWAIFRESQLKALNIPNTGMAVTIDVGEFNDIHPKKKKPVGERLALAAQKIAYGNNNVVYSGPKYKSMELNGKEATLSFDFIGSGLISSDGKELSNFEICGIDNNWANANAKIENNKIVVWNNSITQPVAVRYAWANDPEGINFYNKEGLPASPFRTSDL